MEETGGKATLPYDPSKEMTLSGWLHIFVVAQGKTWLPGLGEVPVSSGSGDKPRIKFISKWSEYHVTPGFKDRYLSDGGLGVPGVWSGWMPTFSIMRRLDDLFNLEDSHGM